jgi:hypothetical protein
MSKCTDLNWSEREANKMEGSLGGATKITKNKKARPNASEDGPFSF